MTKTKMKTCKHCGKEIAKSAKICPHCGGKNKGKLGLILISFVLILGLVGAFGSSGEVVEPYAIGENISMIEEEFGLTYITGAVTNQTDHETSYVQIVFNCLDAEGNVIGTAMDNINYIKAGKTWKFKALIFDCDPEKVVSYELADLTGF